MYLDFEHLDLNTLESQFSADPYYRSVVAFLRHFLEKDTFESNSSGSTGAPKTLQIDNFKAKESAQISNEYFGITSQTKFLHCLDNKYIGAKMLLIRAFMARAKVLVIKPSLEFFKNCDQEEIDFISLTPIHIQKIVEERPHFFSRVKQCLIGASAISPALEAELLTINSDTKFYESFAMTETLSHFAIRNISAREKSFRLLRGFTLSVDGNQCLQIQHPIILPQRIVTNDMIHMKPDGTFTFTGRLDNVINTGGIKISPEIMEQEWSSFLEFRFILAGENDPILGQKIILIAEAKSLITRGKIIDLLQKNSIPSRLCPKAFFVSEFWAETQNHKPIRKEIFAMRKPMN